jgi:hypothetical protein
MRVTIERMPTLAQYDSWLTLLRENPGTTKVILRTPEGELTETTGCSLTLHHTPKINMIFAGAEVTLDTDLTGIMDGIQL